MSSKKVSKLSEVEEPVVEMVTEKKKTTKSKKVVEEPVVEMVTEKKKTTKSKKVVEEPVVEMVTEKKKTTKSKKVVEPVVQEPVVQEPVVEMVTEKKKTTKSKKDTVVEESNELSNTNTSKEVCTDKLFEEKKQQFNSLIKENDVLCKKHEEIKSEIKKLTVELYDMIHKENKSNKSENIIEKKVVSPMKSTLGKLASNKVVAMDDEDSDTTDESSSDSDTSKNKVKNPIAKKTVKPTLKSKLMKHHSDSESDSSSDSE
jgi:hypothetical protein